MDRIKLRAEIERDEGKRLDAYQDTMGYWTIGIGHLLGKVKRMTVITEDECSALYSIDVGNAEALARDCVAAFDTLSDERQRALVNMAFNRGGHMKASTTITPAINNAVTSGDWAAVKTAIKASEWADQIGPRADRIADQLA